MSGWLLPLVGLFGSCIVAAANYAVQRWRYRIDQINAAIERVCQEAALAADRATRYWQIDAGMPNNVSQVAELEAQLLGFQMRLQEGILGLQFQDAKLDVGGTETILPDMFDRMTGGNFQVPGRPPDLPRSRDVQAQAAFLCGSLRRAMARRAQKWL